MANAPAPYGFTAEDDGFHPGTDPWWTETSWFSFNVPERRMGCWLYGWARPNLGNSGGGVFVWDHTATAPWELPYYRYLYTQPLPQERDLRAFTFPESYRVEMVEPLKRYRLSYRDREHIRIDAEFTASCDPHPFMHGEPPFHSSGHFDQPGHIVGEMVLRGERIAIDSYSVRDRSWGPRWDHKGNRIGYPFGVARDTAFCCFAVPDQEPALETSERINHGFFFADGRRVQLKEGVRHVTRDPLENWITAMRIEAVDVEGRELLAEGTAESRMFLNVPRGVTVNSSLRWSINGTTGYGEDQDVWRYDQWLAAKRVLKG
jgi:hypothetical protein